MASAWAGCPSGGEGGRAVGSGVETPAAPLEEQVEGGRLLPPSM